MINRFKTSLFSPALIYKFAKDKVIYLIGYYLLLLLIATLPQMIRIAYLDTLSTDMRSEIRNQILGNEDFPNCTLEANVLMGCEDATFRYDNFLFLFQPSDVPSTFGVVVIVFEEQELSLYTSGQKLETYTYESLNLDDLRFEALKEGDFDQYETLYAGIENFMIEIRLYWAPALMISHFAYSVFYFSLIVLAVALIYTNRVIRVAFKTRLRLATYAATPFFIGLLISELYGIPELIFVFLIFPYIYMNRAVIGYIQSQIQNKPQ